ncbi:hypothetical protein [Ectobacillus funiculus]|uniref:hypothetical protein n=1 Tax=Ectobacillus funiculus TaxID=137993 RepID=UPI00101C932B|nr:hypothetical protein [Ectobacillus funiculus]
MGVFINRDNHPNIYKNNQTIYTSNQEIVRRNALTELMNEQQKATMALIQAIAELNIRYEQLEEKQSNQWNDIQNQMNSLTANSRQREAFESQLMQQLHRLEEKSIGLQSLLEHEGQVKQSLLEQVDLLRESNREIASRLEKNEATNEQLSLQLNEQLELQKDVVDTLTNQEEVQAGMLKRLDNQEALTEKISRQLNHIRSIIFERTNYLATKLEDGYKLTSSYVYKFMTGSDQPLTFSLMNNKKKEKEKEKQKHSD